MPYNGWTNYETWNVALWLGNDEGLYCAYREALECEPFTADSLAALVMNELLPEGTPDFEGPADYREVNWQEIADNLNTERSEEGEESEEEETVGA
jgi:hypothetical protein